MDTSHPIGLLFKIIDDGVRFTSDVDAPFLPSQLIKMAYQAVMYSVIYTDAYKYWCRKTSTDKTWYNYKIFSALEYKQFREEQHLNATQAGFQHVDMLYKTNKTLLQHWKTWNYQSSQKRM